MCRRKTRYHILCEHTHQFLTIECEKLIGKKEKHIQKQGFWSKLLSSKPSCKVAAANERVLFLCPWCTRARWTIDGLVYPSDEYGNDIDISDSNVEADSKAKVTYQSKFKEEFLSRGPGPENLPKPEMPVNLRDSFIELSSSQSMNRPGEHLPEIQSKLVHPGIDFNRWGHVRDHIIPPMPGPPPNKALPPTPPGRQHIDAPKRKAPVHQSRQPDITTQRIRRKPVPGQGVDVAEQTMQNSEHVHGVKRPDTPTPESPSSDGDYPLPLILDYNRELPEFPWLPEPDLGRSLTSAFVQKAQTSSQGPQTPTEQVIRGGSGTNLPREKPVRFQYASVSDPADDIEVRTLRRVDNHAQITSEEHERMRSRYDDVAYISPKLEKRIHDVEDYWMLGALEPSKGKLEKLNRAETEPVPLTGQGQREKKSKSAKKLRFDDNVRGGTR